MVYTYIRGLYGVHVVYTVYTWLYGIHVVYIRHTRGLHGIRVAALHGQTSVARGAFETDDESDGGLSEGGFIIQLCGGGE